MTTTRPENTSSHRHLIIQWQGFILLTALLALSGCDSSGQSREPLREQLRGGGERLSYLALDRRPLRFEAVEEWEVWEEGAPYLFSEVRDVVGGDDSFFLLDGGNLEVVELARDGSVLNVFGREGSGPGELRYPLRMVMYEGELWISDVRNVRFSIFDLDGHSLRESRWPAGSRLVNEYAITPRGGIVHGGMWPLTVAELALQDPLYYLAEFVEEGEGGDVSSVRVDTLLTMPVEPWSGIIIRSEKGRERYWGEAPVFSPAMHWAAGGGALVTVTSADYRFEVRNPGGRVLLEVACPKPDLRVTDAHRQWYFDSFARLALESAEPFILTSDSKARFEFASELPAIAGISIDGSGNIYVLANTPEPGVTRLDCFSPGGEYQGSIGEIGLPAAFLSDGTILLREYDPDGYDRFTTGVIR